MKMLSFKGGVHPPDNKQETNHKPIIVLQPEEIMIFPMVQHLGAPCKPIVQKGDHVFMGQKIGEPEVFLCSPVHSSVSGVVTSVSPHTVANGSSVMCVTVENDFKDELCPGICPPKPGTPISEVVKEAGIVGMGGAGFPTHIKLSPPKDKKIDYIIVNGSECEPYITSDHRVMLETPEKVIGGLKRVLSELKVENGFIAIESNKQDAFEVITEAAKKESNIKVLKLQTKYPQGSEKQLINAVCGRQVPSGELPMDAGVIVLNIDTCTAIYNAFSTGMPLIKRIVTVAGPAVREPKNFEARTGMSARTLYEAAGGFFEEPEKLIMGGPMMGIALSTYEVPVIKTTGALLAFGKADIHTDTSMACIRCGRCVSACPMGLLPYQLCNYSEVRDYDKCKKFSVLDCIECGACVYTCPSKRHIVQSVRLAKAQLKRKG